MSIAPVRQEPWSGCEREDIIVKLRSGESPMVQSKLLGEEGQDFLQTHCFISDPDRRATAVQLLKHTFIKVMHEYSVTVCYM